MPRIIVVPLRIAIVGAFLCGVFAAAVVIPTTAADDVEAFPPYEPYAVPYATAAILALVCVLGTLVAAWALLSLANRDAIFSHSALPWVNVIIGCLGAATLLAAGVCVSLMFSDIPSPDDGMEVIGAVMASGACAALGGTFVLLLLVMRQLLQKATVLRVEMAEVV
jgi:hypothetical protein